MIVGVRRRAYSDDERYIHDQPRPQVHCSHIHGSHIHGSKGHGSKGHGSEGHRPDACQGDREPDACT
jgi:hypothetical protein